MQKTKLEVLSDEFHALCVEADVSPEWLGRQLVAETKLRLREPLVTSDICALMSITRGQVAHYVRGGKLKIVGGNGRYHVYDPADVALLIEAQRARAAASQGY